MKPTDPPVADTIRDQPPVADAIRVQPAAADAEVSPQGLRS